jgi:propionate catabolism operon transcriptional regulator
MPFPRDRATANAKATPSSPRSRICVLAFGRLASLVEEAARELAEPIELIVEHRRFRDAVAQARALIARGDVDAFVSAGANGAELRRQLDYPVALVSASGFDVMAALVQAARLSRTSPPSVGLVTYDHVGAELGELSRLLKIELHLSRYSDVTDVRACVRDLRSHGVDVIIGPSLVTEAAAELGLPGVFLYTLEGARRALEEAIAAARVRVLERTRRRQLGDLIGQLQEGVLAIDMEQHIWLANPAMCALAGVAEADLTNQTLLQLIPELDAREVLTRGGPPLLRRVFTLGHQRMIGNLLPLDAGDDHGHGHGHGLAQARDPERRGAVLTVQAASSVERAGRDLHRHARRHAPRARHVLADLVGASPAMQALRALAERFAALDLTVLIHGESGTGKELVAQGIHNASPRAREAFVAINCAAMPESLLESELFGYEEGAFTGAVKGGKPGLFETAHGGTVFLDEIGDMPGGLQARLLRVLQEREVLRVGGREPIPIDVRIVAATHRDLAERMRAGAFRADLYYRVNGLAIAVPPLRARREDLPELITHIASRHARTPLPESLRRRFLAVTAGHPWPGNVRELENMVERLLAVGAELTRDPHPEALDRLLPELSERAPAASSIAAPPAATAAGASTTSLRRARERAERERLVVALEAAGGNLGIAARALGISRTTLWRKLARPKIDDGTG